MTENKELPCSTVQVLKEAHNETKKVQRKLFLCLVFRGIAICSVIENVGGMPFHAGIIPRLIFYFLKIYLNQFCASDYIRSF